MVRILIVNDLLSSRLRLRDILSRAGYDVLVVESGEMALEIAQSVLPDLILMDIVLSGVSGLETAARLRENPELQAVPIILLGHLPPLGIDAEPLSSLVEGYLNTEVSTDELLACVSKLVP